METKQLKLRTTTKKKAEGVYSFIGSTAAVDRVGEVVEQNWELANYLKNPVILYAHDQSGLPVGKAVRAEVVDGRLEFDVKFVDRNTYPFAGIVEDMVAGDFLSAVSVGFIPLDIDGNVIKKSELLELSIVPVPANYEALRNRGEKRILPVFKAWDSSALRKDVRDPVALAKFIGTYKAEDPPADPPTEPAPPREVSLDGLAASIAHAVECLNAEDMAGLAVDLTEAQAIVVELIAAQEDPPEEAPPEDPPADEAKALVSDVLKQLSAPRSIESTLADPDAVSKILHGLRSPKKES